MSWIKKSAYIPLPNPQPREGESAEDFQSRRRDTIDKSRARTMDRATRWKMSQYPPSYIAVIFWNHAPLGEKNRMIETRDVVPLREHIVEYLAGNELPEGFNENIEQEILKVIDKYEASQPPKEETK